MDKRDYAIIGLLLVIIAMLSYGVINAYNDSQPKVFDFGNYVVTAPAGTHYHIANKDFAFYLHENDSYPFFDILYINDSASVEKFDAMYNSLKNGHMSKDELIKENIMVMDDNSSVLDINVGDFKGEPEISMVVQKDNYSFQGIAHIIKHNNKVFMVLEEMNNPSSTQTYNNLILK